MEDLHTENYKTMLSEIKENVNKCKETCCSRVRGPMLLSILSRLSTIPIKILASFFVEIDKLILKCIWKYKEPTVGKQILKRKLNIAVSHL
jgi:hypothetical protein